jgi:hypothetical protein
LWAVVYEIFKASAISWTVYPSIFIVLLSAKNIVDYWKFSLDIYCPILDNKIYQG